MSKFEDRMAQRNLSTVDIKKIVDMPAIASRNATREIVRSTAGAFPKVTSS